MRMAQRADGNAAAHIQITPAGDIPDIAAHAARQHQVKARVAGYHKLFEQTPHGRGVIALERGRRRNNFFHRTISVPTPASVKISRSTEWGMRPSTNDTFSTPALSAATALSILGIIP